MQLFMSKMEASADDVRLNEIRIIDLHFPIGVMKLRDLLSFSPIDILVKSADQKSYHAILQELKDKEIYNMIIDIHDTENMSDFLKAVRLIYGFH